MQISDKNWFVIINPVSGGGKGPKLFARIGPLLHSRNIQFTENVTQSVGHATVMAVEALKNGIKRFIILGGDGTANEVVNGIFTAGVDPAEIIIAMISVGTGNDWVRTIGKHRSLQSIADSLLFESTFTHDVGLVTYQKNANTAERYFINIAGLGFDGYAAKKIAEGPRILQGTKMQYWAAIARTLFAYKHTVVKVEVDGKTAQYQTLSIACGICKYNGGGLMQLPVASCDDGMLDMTLIGNMSKWKMVRSLPKLSNGSFITMKEITALKGKRFTFTSNPPVQVETDGEYLGETPATVSIMQKQIKVLRWE